MRLVPIFAASLPTYARLGQISHLDGRHTPGKIRNTRGATAGPNWRANTNSWEGRKYQFMEMNLQKRTAGLKDKIPEIQKTLDTVRFLKLRRVRCPSTFWSSSTSHHEPSETSGRHGGSPCSWACIGIRESVG